MYYTYMIRCEDNSLYTGITTDPKRRFAEHSGQKSGHCAKYTGSRKVLKFEALWVSENRETASKLEYHIKKLTKAKKEQLIMDNNNFEKFFEKKMDVGLYERIMETG